MTWFPEGQSVPPDCNLPRIDSALSVMNCFDEKIDHKNLTFMIPFGGDSGQRFNNLTYTVSWILLNTNANLRIHICDTKKNIADNMPGWFGTRREQSDSQYVEDLTNYIQNHAHLDDVMNEPAPVDLSAFDCATSDFFTFFMYKVLELPQLFSFSSDMNSSLSFYEFAANYVDDSIPSTNLGIPCPVITPNDAELYNNFRSRIKCTVELREDGEPFHRTRYLNKMINLADTLYVCNHDADIILPTASIDSSLRALHSLGADVVYPYEHAINGNYQLRVFNSDVKEVSSALIQATFQNDFYKLANPDHTIKHSAAYGQSIFVRTEFYKSAGGENEQFKSWGAEDVERYFRFIKLGGRIVRLTKSYVVHLEHPRGNDSSKYNPAFLKNEMLWNRLQDFSCENLVDYYNNLEYVSRYGWQVSLSNEN